MSFIDILNKLKIKIFADGADIHKILSLSDVEYIKGFTTNPSLMRKSGVQNYEKFARSLLEKITKKPISFEVFADDIDEMHVQAKKIASWGKNVNIKIPITNSKGEDTSDLISSLCNEDIQVNVTAIFTYNQIKNLISKINHESKIILSIFAGRIADTGVDPVPLIKEVVEFTKEYQQAEVLWASPRELLNIYHAENSGCHIITIAADIINKLNLIGKDLNQFSLETVNMFYQDAKKSEFKIV
tara:strand:- start:46790 stop:47518 length:729 start_codon:yes stop_codon:yes gene_type:complete